MKKIINIFSIFFLFAILSVCSREQSDPVAPEPIQIERSQKLLVSADNRLGLRLFKKLSAGSNSNTNLLISPISLNKSFSLLLFGVDDNNLKRLLNMGNQKREIINVEIDKLNKTILNIDAQSKFKTSTTFLPSNKLELSPEFENFVSKNLDIKLADELEHQEEEQVQNNSFSIENDIELNCNMKYQTGIAEAPFYINPNQSKFLKMLICESEYNFYSDSYLKAIEMPLGRGNFNALIILPEENQSLKGINRLLNQYYLNRIKGKSRKISLSVYLPKLDIQYNGNLNQGLKKLGLGNLFKSRNLKNSNFYNNQHAFFNNFTHNVKLKTVSKPFSEKELFSGKTESKTSFFIDRPFLLILTEKYSGAILFIGQITNPIN